jgi:hypothetical protein
MNLASLKTSHIAKRKLFEVERAIVREVVDLWCKEKSYFNENFAEDVDVEFKGRRIEGSFSNNRLMQYGAPEATVNDVMKGLILTMATDQATGKLLKNHGAVIGNILDVFVHRLKEIGERKFIFQRLQTLELGFSIAFGLDKEFYPIKKARRFLEEVVMVAGFAGGLGLSGNGCGALSAAMWMNTLTRIRANKYKSSLSDPESEKILKAFHEVTGYEMECSKICGQRFKTIDEHTEFIKSGGCDKLIQILADSNSVP